VQCDWSSKDKNQAYDLAAVEQGARAIAWNDKHFSCAANLLAPGRGVNMGDGWETRRRREPGNYWFIIEPGHPGMIEEVIVDTAHFKGNYPDRCSIQAATVEGGTTASIITQSQFWPELLQPGKLEMDDIKHFTDIQAIGPVSHV
jgi:allantoicase